jgi:hypothetical protein
VPVEHACGEQPLAENLIFIQFNLIQFNPSRGACRTRLRRTAIGGEFTINLN